MQEDKEKRPFNVSFPFDITWRIRQRRREGEKKRGREKKSG